MTIGRKLAIGLIVVGLLVAGQRLLIPFDLETGKRFDGTDVLSVTEECGRAAFILLAPDSELSHVGPNFGGHCTRRSRTRAAEALGVVFVTTVVALNVFRGGFGSVQPIDEALPPLPDAASEVWGRPPQRDRT